MHVRGINGVTSLITINERVKDEAAISPTQAVITEVYPCLRFSPND